ncbi:3'-5' exonuclease [Paenibacillus sp. ATY16]|uniref:3'-5' exonuclease n=1 Tax=Paenibacillus sp. ATY16 TaxID=1759312 RepID=UPI00200C6C4A|nr:3'-5' exonuclease [Paenibacillus sp. ATY16]MCK9858307.1 exonuclease domain-containing protein [Paenibacillus sp. ATY16]
MNYIVFDLEFTVLKDRSSLADILEIGAIKINEIEGELAMVDLFHTYVRPSEHPIITPRTTAFTGITQAQVDAAPNFSDVIQSFIEWLGNSYYLIAWGPDDKQMLVKQCRKQHINPDWIKNYNDIQLPFTYGQGGNNGGRFGLTKALQLNQITFIGTHHNALDDAFNTAKLFKSIFGQLVLKENNAAIESEAESKIVYSTGREVNNPFAKLAGLQVNAVI